MEQEAMKKTVKNTNQMLKKRIMNKSHLRHINSSHNRVWLIVVIFLNVKTSLRCVGNRQKSKHPLTHRMTFYKIVVSNILIALTSSD
jgi:hypothetical protein